MKKTIFMIVIATLVGSTINAQNSGTDTRDALHFGLKIGANYSNVYDTKGDEFKADPKFGFVAGAFVSIPIGTILGVQPEILFSQKGFKATGVILGNTYEFTRTTSYIDIPLLIAIKPTPMITLLAGPQYSYLIKRHDKFTSGTTTIDQEQEFENDNIRKNLLCFIGGLDLNFDSMVIGARVGWDITQNNGDGSSVTPQYKNVWYQATIGFKF
ncbi:MAG TPA: porin family protein [Williamwhitmania sp.]|nr:porin family protein [Williamwhitmania sp.]